MHNNDIMPLARLIAGRYGFGFGLNLVAGNLI
jgi:hypothetical protein